MSTSLPIKQNREQSDLICWSGSSLGAEFPGLLNVPCTDVFLYIYITVVCRAYLYRNEVINTSGY